MSDHSTAAGWEEHEQAQRRAWLSLTSRQRLDWLWEARQFALRAASAKVRNPASEPRPRPLDSDRKP